MNGNMKTLKTIRSLLELNRCAFYKSRKLCIYRDNNTTDHKIHCSWIRAKVFYPRFLGVKEYGSTQRAKGKGQKAMKPREETPWTLAETPPTHYVLCLWINLWLCVQKPFCLQVFCDPPPPPHFRLVIQPAWITTHCLRICSMHYRDPVTRVLSQELKEITKL